MNQKLRFLMLALLCAMTNFAWGDRWEEVTDLSTLDYNGNDIIVIVDKASSRAMSNNNGTSSAPSALEVTLNDNETEIISDVNDNLKWRFISTGGTNPFYLFKKYSRNNDTSDYLYVGTNAASSNNNCLRVGPETNSVETSHNNKFQFAEVGDNVFLKFENTKTTRFIGVYNNQDWRGYTTTNTISDTRIAFYKKTADINYTLTAVSNNPDYGTVSVSGNKITATPNTDYRISTSTPYTVTSGTATISQNGNVFTVNATADCTVQINFEAIPTYTATFTANGTVVSSAQYQEGEDITFPANPADEDDYKFMGWTTAEITGTSTTAPTMVTSATMGTTAQNFYAVYALLYEGGEPTTKICDFER